MKEMEYEEEFLTIFGAVCGYTHYPDTPEWAESARQADSVYARSLAEFQAAQQSLCRRFGLNFDTDEDLDRLSAALASIELDIARRLFHCGIQFARCGRGV